MQEATKTDRKQSLGERLVETQEQLLEARSILNRLLKNLRGPVPEDGKKGEPAQMGPLLDLAMRNSHEARALKNAALELENEVTGPCVPAPAR